MSDTKQNYLFVSGCARSGTTALTRLLNSHPEIEITVEKFGHIFQNKPDQFSSKLVDTNTEKKYTGDKFPGYYKDFPLIFKNFPNAKMLFIYRNIFDVAQSYKARKLDDLNDWDKGPKRAVTEWNQSIRLAIIGLKNSRNIVPLCYEKVMFNNDNLIINKLNLQKSSEFDEKYNQIIKVGRKLNHNRRNILTNREKLWIMENARFDLYRKLNKITMS